MQHTQSDTDLIRQIAAADKNAFKQLYDKYHVRIYRFALSRLGDVALAEDVTTEVFWDIWKTAGRFEGRSAVTTWMFTIARNKSVDLLRKRKELPLPEGVAERMEDGADTPELAAQKSSKSAILKSCLAQLSDKHKQIIHLVYYQEMSVKQAGDILGVPNNTVKTRMFHARKQLQGILEREGLDHEWP